VRKVSAYKVGWLSVTKILKYLNRLHIYSPTPGAPASFGLNPLFFLSTILRLRVSTMFAAKKLGFLVKTRV
jgi:hypothetical protein